MAYKHPPITMKNWKYFMVTIWVFVLASCGNGSKNNNSEQPKPIITLQELLGGVWVSAAFYSESMQAFIPVVDKEAMIGFVFQQNGTCKVGFGTGEVSEAFTFEINHNKLILHGSKKDIDLDIKDYANGYLEVVIKSGDSPKDMRCKLKKMKDD